VWPGVFVGDAVLKSTIRELRKALGDDSHEPRFIETAHRRGYRFMAPVTAIAAAGARQRRASATRTAATSTSPIR
jgi:DNA-binding winged helix-turn-helix (wHTH) protein